VALEIDGTFDDCQALVKSAFMDEELNNRLNLTSANSINVARFLPQSFYYFYAYAQLAKQTAARDVVFPYRAATWATSLPDSLPNEWGSL